MLSTLNPYLPAFRLSFSTSSSFRLLFPKEGNSLSISKLDIESIASPATRSSTKNYIRDLLDLFQWDAATTETQSDMDIEDSTANMERSKEGTSTTFHDCPSSQDKEKSEKSKKMSTYRIGAYSIIFLNSNTLSFILYFISTHFSLSMIKGLAKPSPV